MYDFYCQYFVPYAEVLSDIERRGIKVVTLTVGVDTSRLVLTTHHFSDRLMSKAACQRHRSELKLTATPPPKHSCMVPGCSQVHSSWVTTDMISHLPPLTQ